MFSRTMIEINLLPEELKSKTQKTGFGQSYIFLGIPLIIFILLFIQLILLVRYSAKVHSLSVLNGKWVALAPKVKMVEDLKKSSGTAAADSQAAKLVSQRIDWSEKLYLLSKYLPNGICFTSLSLVEKEFILKGSVISLQKEEMNLINKFLTDVSKDKNFIGDFGSLELSSVQESQKSSFEIVDFVLSGVLKSKDQKQKR